MAEIVDFGLQQHKIKMDSRYFENVLSVVAGDTGRRIEVQLLDTNGMVQNTTGLNLRLNALIAGKATYTDATLVDAATGKYQLDLSNGMFLAPGNWQFQWQITDSAGKKLHSFAFTGNVGSNISEGGSQATNFYLNLEDLKAMQEDFINGAFDSAALETNIAEKLEALEETYAPRLTEVAEQLEQNTMKDLNRNIIGSTGVNVATKPNARPMVTFIDDDGDIEVYTRLKPIFESRGVPCTIAIVSDWVGTEGNGNSWRKHMSKEQILELQDLGWEVASHEKTHIAMGDVTDEEVIYNEIVQSKKDLLAMGFDVKNLVYPFGQKNDSVVKVAQTVYKNSVNAGNAANEQTNVAPLSNFSLGRVALGTYEPVGKDTLEHHKSVVDKAITENSWVIFMTHIWAQSEEKDQLIADVLDYAIGQNVDVVNFDEGLDVFGDIMTIPDAFRIIPNGKIISDDLAINKLGEKNGVTNNTPITEFETGKVTYNVIGGGTPAEGFPENSAGLLTTDRISSESGYESQYFKRYNSNRRYERNWHASRGWEEWQMVSHRLQIANISHTFGTISPLNTAELAVDVPGTTSWDVAVVNPSSTPVSGIIWSARTELGKVIIRVANVKNIDVNVTNHNWVISVFKSNV